MTGRYPSASTALPTSLAMVFTALKSSLEAAGKPASIISTPSLASCRAIGDVIGAAAIGEWSLIGRNREWETEIQSGSKGE